LKGDTPQKFVGTNKTKEKASELKLGRIKKIREEGNVSKEQERKGREREEMEWKGKGGNGMERKGKDGKRKEE